MSAGADRYREDQLFEEWLEWYRDRKLGPVDPEVAAILKDWEDGGHQLPWTDARPEPEISSDEDEPRGFPAAGEDTAA